MNEQTFNEDCLTHYLTDYHQRPVVIQRISQLGSQSSAADALKGFSYGHPIRITFTDDDCEREIVLRQVKRNGFGRERDSDRIAEVWRDFHTFNNLPQHIVMLRVQFLYFTAQVFLHKVYQVVCN